MTAEGPDKSKSQDAATLIEARQSSVSIPEVLVPVEEYQSVFGLLPEARERLNNLLEQSEGKSGKIIFRWADGQEEVHTIIRKFKAE